MTGEKPITWRVGTPIYYNKYRAEDGHSPVVAVVEALATVKEIDPLELDPLYEVIDMEALQRLFEDHDDTSGRETTLSFQVDGLNIIIRNDGLILVCDPSEPSFSAPAFNKTSVN